MDAPQGPTELATGRWWAATKRVVKRYGEDDLGDRAAALTYYSVLSLFPALVALVSLVGLFGEHPRTTNALLEIVADIGPESATETYRGTVQTVVENNSGAGVALVLGLAVAAYGASAYIGAFARASNAIYETSEGRPFWKLRPLQVLLALAMVLMLALVGLAVALTGPIAKAVAQPLGLGDTALTIWSVAKWPVLLLAVALMFSVLYYTAPNVRQRRFRWVTPGGLLALALWLTASAGFAFYVANFGSYNKTYGSLAGVVMLLLWLWITNIALLLGAGLNAELERQRELSAGVEGADEEIQLPPRQAAKT